MNIAIVGATGNVGRKTLEVFDKKNFKFDALHLVASKNSAGKKITIRDKEYEIENLETYDFSKANITFFAAGGKIAEQYAEKAAKHTMVIDNSSFFRMDPDVPLVVPQVNAESIKKMKKNIIANPNCSTAQLVIALKPLHDLFEIERIVVSTYQSVSGAGKSGMDELWEQTKAIYNPVKDVSPEAFTKQIAFNVIPHIDSFMEDGTTREEWKMVAETKKIIDPKIKVSATCVRVPVFVGHSEAVNIEFEEFLDEDEARNILREAPGVIVLDKRENGGYATPVECVGDFATFISRIRQDSTIENGLNLWCVSDNLRKGAALNAVQIAEVLVQRCLKKGE